MAAFHNVTFTEQERCKQKKKKKETITNQCKRLKEEELKKSTLNEMLKTDCPFQTCTNRHKPPW